MEYPNTITTMESPTSPTPLHHQQQPDSDANNNSDLSYSDPNNNSIPPQDHPLPNTSPTPPTPIPLPLDPLLPPILLPIDPLLPPPPLPHSSSSSPLTSTQDSSPPQSLKRRRKKKEYPEMIPSDITPKVRTLRPHGTPKHSPDTYTSKLMDQLINKQISNDITNLKSKRMAKEVDSEASIATSLGFSVDSLTEEEIESNVVTCLGGVEQRNYIVVRNHVLAKWRTNVETWLTKEKAMDSIRSEHRGLVGSAYRFLLEHGYINFGLAAAAEEEIKEMCVKGAPSVIIVGAGLAGLAAARHLLSFGFKVVILEGRSRPGGRVRTKKMVGENGVEAAADLGGSVLTGINGNPFGVLARQLGFPLHKVRDICPLYLPDGTAVNSDMDARIEQSFNRLLEKVCNLRHVMLEEVKGVDVSLGSAIEVFRRVYQVAGRSQERMLLDWHLANLEYANASTLSDLSMAFWDQDDPYEMGGDHCFIPGGNVRFVRALAQDLPIFYNKTVERIQYGSDGVMVYADGQVFRGDMVLCTVPLGVLKSGSIDFIPELPQLKQDAIERMGFGLLNKVLMLFPYDFWGGGIDTFGHLTEDSSKRGEFFLFYSYSAVSGGPLLVALVAGESAVKFESLPPIDAVTKVLDVLRGIFAPKGIEVPNPVQVICTRWGKDKFTYGSYSYVAVGASGDDYDLLAESVGDGRVFFAGEATNRQYPATMHGAFLSGLREAANILRAANRKSFVAPESYYTTRETANAMDADNYMETDDDDDLFENAVEMVNSKEPFPVKEEKSDLDQLFGMPDLCFGSFSVLFDPRSSDLESASLIRVGFGEDNLESGPLFLYGLLPRKQVMELNDIAGDGDRVRVLNRKFGISLVGRKSLGADGESLIAYIKEARSDPNWRVMIDAPCTMVPVSAMVN